jgi:hypothetical protein
MAYWKFLLAGAVSPFTGYAWQPGQWVSVDESHECQAGFHACRAGDLPYWLNAELWEFELATPVVQAASKVVSIRAIAAVAKVREWDAETASEVALACARRMAIHAADELSDAHLGDEAGELAEVTAAAPPGEWLEIAERCAAAASARGAPGRKAMRLCAGCGRSTGDLSGCLERVHRGSCREPAQLGQQARPLPRGAGVASRLACPPPQVGRERSVVPRRLCTLLGGVVE